MATYDDHLFVNKAVYNLIKGVYGELESEELSNKLSTWYKQPPKYTIVRVDYPKNVEEELGELQQILDKIYKEREQTSPTVYVHHALKDVLVIPSPNEPDPVVNSDKEIIVDVNCATAVLRGANVYAPGVLGTPSNLREDDKVAVYADIMGKCLRGLKIKFEGTKMFLGNGIAICDRDNLFGTNCSWGLAVFMINTFGNCPPLGDDILSKNMFLQNLPSVLCSHVLNPKPTDCVLDMCAAPGGKTLHLASIMHDNGLIIALDRSKNRLDKLKSNIKSAGYTSVHAFAYDSTKALDSVKSSPDFKNKSVLPPPYPDETFDCIMLDAPCSALGQRPQIGNNTTEVQVRAFPKLQKKLISMAVGLLKPGGKLVYSTCSLLPSENEEVISWTLNKYPQVQLDHQKPCLGGPGLKVSGLDDTQLQMLQRFDMNSPGQAEDGDTIGFFIAKLVKTSPVVV